MKAAIALCVGHQLVALFVVLAAVVDILLLVLVEVVVLHEVVAGVVGRVDIDHLHLAQIVLAENLQHLQIVALDI